MQKQGEIHARQIIYILLKQKDSRVIRDNNLVTRYNGNKLGKSRDSIDNVGHLLVIVFGDCLVIQIFYYPSYFWVFTWDLYTCDRQGDTSYQRKYPTVRQMFFNVCVRKPTMRCFQTVWTKPFIVWLLYPLSRTEPYNYFCNLPHFM